MDLRKLKQIETNKKTVIASALAVANFQIKFSYIKSPHKKKRGEELPL